MNNITEPETINKTLSLIVAVATVLGLGKIIPAIIKSYEAHQKKINDREKKQIEDYKELLKLQKVQYDEEIIELHKSIEDLKKERKEDIKVIIKYKKELYKLKIENAKLSISNLMAVNFLKDAFPDEANLIKKIKDEIDGEK